LEKIEGEQEVSKEGESKGYYPSQLDFSMTNGWFMHAEKPRYGKDVDWGPVQPQAPETKLN
jgi:hypothetical protein